MNEADLQNTVLELAHIYGWTTYHTWDSRRSREGFPDLVLVRSPRLMFVELKSATGSLSAHQELWLAELRAVPCAEVHVWRPADLDQVIPDALAPESQRRSREFAGG